MTTNTKRTLLKAAFLVGLLALATTMGLGLFWQSNLALEQLMVLAISSGLGLLLVVVGKVGLLLMPKE